jgi:type IV pilus assembly protein PilE
MMHATTPTQRRAVRGFTLLELMITVAIIGVIAAVAYPAYTGSVLKARRAEGRAALTELLQQQERYLTQTGSYMTFAAGATGANGTTRAGAGQSIVFRTTSGTSAGNAAYDLAAAACTAASGAMALNECVQLSAVPRRSDPQAGTLTLRSTGLKSCNGSNASICWK